MSDKLCWQYDRGKTYDKSDIGTLKLLADGKYREWHCTAVTKIGGNLFKHFTWHKAGGWHYNRGQYSGGALYLFFALAICKKNVNCRSYMNPILEFVSIFQPLLSK